MASKAKRAGQSLGGKAGRHFLALEPRMMFDGAAVATAAAGAEALVPTSAEAPAPDAGWTVADQPSEERPTQDETPDIAPADPAPTPRAIVFVDGAVEDYQALIDAIDGDYEIIVLDPNADGSSRSPISSPSGAAFPRSTSSRTATTAMSASAPRCSTPRRWRATMPTSSRPGAPR